MIAVSAEILSEWRSRLLGRRDDWERLQDEANQKGMFVDAEFYRGIAEGIDRVRDDLTSIINTAIECEPK